VCKRRKKYDYGAVGERYRQENPNYSVGKRSLSMCTLSTKDILLLTDFLAASKFTATVPVSLYISKSTNWNESLVEISK